MTLALPMGKIAPEPFRTGSPHLEGSLALPGGQIVRIYSEVVCTDIQ